MIESLEKYRGDPEEEPHKLAMIALIRTHPDCFHRTHFDPGHITGSALLISADGSRVLMNHHKFLNMWLCFGGHADGEKDILNVSMREAIEESGIAEIEPVSLDIFDVDVHEIPANPKKGEPAHKHFDICYLFRVKNSDSETFVASEESNSLRWCGYDQAVALASPDDAAMRRMLKKWNDRTR